MIRWCSVLALVAGFVVGLGLLGCDHVGKRVAIRTISDVMAAG